MNRVTFDEATFRIELCADVFINGNEAIEIILKDRFQPRRPGTRTNPGRRRAHPESLHLVVVREIELRVRTANSIVASAACGGCALTIDEDGADIRSPENVALHS